MSWNPDKYLKFKNERFFPFLDLSSLINKREGINAIDLGCGSGELTEKLCDLLPNSQILGIDSSPEMLKNASKLIQANLRFELRKIEDFEGTWDLIFSNAALHWIDNHETLFPNLLKALNQGGQMVAQFPSGHRNAAHKLLTAISESEPFKSGLNGWKWVFPVLSIEEYAELLFQSGGQEITVYDKVFSYVLTDYKAVYDFTSSTSMLPYLKHLPDELREDFKNSYLHALKDHWRGSPVFFGFRRIFLSVMKTSTSLH